MVVDELVLVVVDELVVVLVDVDELVVVVVDVELLVLPEMPHGFMAIACGMTDVWAKRTYQWFARTLEAR